LLHFRRRLIVEFSLIPTAGVLMPRLALRSGLIVALLDYLTLLCCFGLLDMHQQPLPPLLRNNRQPVIVANSRYRSHHSVAVAVLLRSYSCFQCRHLFAAIDS